MLAAAFSVPGHSLLGPRPVRLQSKLRAEVAVPPGGNGLSAADLLLSDRNGIFQAPSNDDEVPSAFD